MASFGAAAGVLGPIETIVASLQACSEQAKASRPANDGPRDPGGSDSGFERSDSGECCQEVLCPGPAGGPSEIAAAGAPPRPKSTTTFQQSLDHFRARSHRLLTRRSRTIELPIFPAKPLAPSCAETSLARLTERTS
jgi:hypothetical protein